MITTTAVLAQGITRESGQNIQDLVLPIIGSFLLIIIGGRLVAALMEERYGKMLSLIAGGVVVAGFVFLPDQAVGILKGLWNTFVSGGGA